MRTVLAPFTLDIIASLFPAALPSTNFHTHFSSIRPIWYGPNSTGLACLFGCARRKLYMFKSVCVHICVGRFVLVHW